MHRIAALLVSLVLGASPALAGPTWTAIGVAIAPENVEKAIAALDELNASPVAKQRPGEMALMSSVIDGADPTTHSIIVSYDSLAQQEAFVGKLLASAEYKKFQRRFGELSTPTGITRQSFVKSWGTEDASDAVWHIHAFSVSNPAGFVAALDALMSSKAAAEFPGQIQLSAVAAAGLSDVTHLIGVGFQSEAEGEAWGDGFAQTQAWATYLEAAGKVSTFRGTYILRSVKTWGGN